MKKLLIIFVCATAFLSLGWMFSGCSKCSLPFKKVPEIKPEDMANSLAKALCEKDKSCGTEMNADECVKQISSGLVARLQDKERKPVDQSAFDTCVLTIQGASCDILKQEKPPAECSFLE